MLVSTANAERRWDKTDLRGIQDAALAPDGTIWVCQDNGKLSYSRNKGKNWNHTKDKKFTRVSANATYVVACDSDGKIWHSTNKGKDWKEGGAENVADVAIDTNNVIVCCGKDGAIWLIHPDSNRKWQRFDALDKTVASGFQSVAANGKVLFAAGKNGTIWYANYDVNTQASDLKFNKTVASGFARISVDPSGVVWACGNNGTVWCSKDNGVNWEKKNFEQMLTYEPGSGFGVAIGMDGSLKISQE